jgi:hypothetical protein
MRINKTMSEYDINVRTDKDIGSEHFVRDLLSAWCGELDVRLRPEFFGLGEPIRRSIAKEGIEAAVRTWVDSGMSVLLRRRSKPKFEASIEWWRREKSLDPRPFPWGCSVTLSLSAGDELALKLFRFLIRYFEPAFGHISTYDDRRAKHFITYEDRVGQAEQYVGMDVGETLPGVYWVTYFGPWSVKKVGEDRFATLKAYKVEPINSGYLVYAYSTVKEAGSSAAQEAENQIMNHLGRANFFDKALVNIEALKTDLETAEIIEKKITEVKEKRKK